MYQENEQTSVSEAVSLAMPGRVEQFLREAKGLIAEREHWTRGIEHSRDLDGVDTYCALGAIRSTIMAARHLPTYMQAKMCLAEAIAGKYVRPTLAGATIIDFNDNSSEHHEVIAAFDRAIALAHERGV